MDAANSCARVLISRSRDGAGIEHDNVSIHGGLGWRKTECRKLAFKSGAICLRGPATKALYEKFRHERYYNLTFGTIFFAATHNLESCCCISNFAN